MNDVNNAEMNEVRLKTLINDVGQIRAEPFNKLLRTVGRDQYICSRAYKSYMAVIKHLELRDKYNLKLTKDNGLKITYTHKCADKRYTIYGELWLSGDEESKPRFYCRVRKLWMTDKRPLDAVGTYEIRASTNSEIALIKGIFPIT